METPERLAADPLGAVPRDGPPAHRETAAFMAAALAFGNVKAIRASVGRVVAGLDDPAALRAAGHRWVRGPDVEAVVRRIRDLQEARGSLGRAFLDCYRPDDMRASLVAFGRLLAEGLDETHGVRFLVSTPERGGAAKRMNLFLRWVVRKEGFDLGLWSGVRTEDLVVPLDVHMVRFARRFGLTRRSTADWKMAAEVTAGLRAFDATDPLRWDFAISHYGMVRGWETPR